MGQMMNEQLFCVVLFIMVLFLVIELCFMTAVFIMSNRKIKVLERQMRAQSVKQEPAHDALQENLCEIQDIQSEQERCRMQKIQSGQDVPVAAGEVLQKKFSSSENDVEIINEVLSEVF